MVVTEKHLWLNLLGIKRMEKTFLLDPRISHSGLTHSGNSVDSVVGRFREARAHLAAFRKYIT